MESILSHPGLRGLRRWALHARDVRLYEKFGFRAPKNGETYMEIVNP